LRLLVLDHMGCDIGEVLISQAAAGALPCVLVSAGMESGFLSVTPVFWI